MRDFLPGILFCLIAAGGLYAAMRIRTMFLLKIENGRVTRIHGDAPDWYVRDVERMCDFWSITKGRVSALRHGKRVRISVGGGIPRKYRQAFQNAWNHPV